MNARERELIKELAGTVCRCGNQKASGNTFCGRCYFKLPKTTHPTLYRRVGQGYEQAYKAAAEYLDNAQARAAQ